MKVNYKKHIIQLSIPILMNYFVTTSFEFVDKAMLGHYSTASFAAVGVIARMIYVLTGSFGIFTNAFHIIAAKKRGNEDEIGFESSFRIALNIVHMVGIIFFVLTILFGRFFCKSVYGMQSTVLKEALDYLYPASFTLWLNLLLFLFAAYFRNLKNTKLSFYSTVIATVVNLFFDYALVYGHFGFPELGGKGTAFTMILNGMVSRLSIEEIGTYQLLETLGSFLLLPAYAYSSTGLTLALQKKEKGSADEVRKLIKASIQLAVFTILFFGFICCVASKQLMQLIVSDLQMIQAARKILPFVLCLQLLRALYEIYKGFLQGILISIVYLIPFVRWFGITGIYCGLLLTYIFFFFLLHRKLNGRNLLGAYDGCKCRHK